LDYIDRELIIPVAQLDDYCDSDIQQAVIIIQAWIETNCGPHIPLNCIDSSNKSFYQPNQKFAKSLIIELFSLYRQERLFQLLVYKK
jgi:hypothetical protein